MSRKRLLEAALPQDRAAQRRRLGSLKELTVQPATKKRYTAATQNFMAYLRKADLALPQQKTKLDAIVSDYIDYLWSSGAGRAQACDTLAGLQDLQPDLRHHLPGSWRLLKTWSINEIPARAPPLPVHVVQAMAGWAFFKGHYSFGVSLLLGFYCMLRTGEILGLKSSHMFCGKQDKQIVVSLGFTKGGKRQGAAESVVLGYEPVVMLIRQWKSLAQPVSSFVKSSAQWRKLFNECLSALHLEEYQFRPYSLRRGGATYWFSQHQSLDRLLIQGRWASQKTARIYVNEGLAMLANMQLPKTHPDLKPFLSVYSRTSQTHNFSTLEPPVSKTGRTGGRGKRNRLGARNSRKRPFFVTALFQFLSEPWKTPQKNPEPGGLGYGSAL